MDPEDSFSFNEDFSSSLQRIKISTIATKVENNDQRKETRDKVDEERKFQTEVRHSISSVSYMTDNLARHALYES